MALVSNIELIGLKSPTSSTVSGNDGNLDDQDKYIPTHIQSFGGYTIFLREKPNARIGTKDRFRVKKQYKTEAINKM
jgi:hypothetical protein